MSIRTLISFGVLLSCIAVSSLHAQVNVSALTCEYQINPVGLGTAYPRLSWKLEASKSSLQDIVQTAYEVRVADRPGKLKSGKDLIWTSGKTASAQSTHIAYNGPALQSAQRLYWQVRVWTNKSKKSSAWSAPAFWEMGLLTSADWQASFITPAIEEDINKSEPCPFLRKEFSIGKAVKSARVYVTSLGLYELQLNGRKVGDQVFTPGWTSYNNRLQYQVYDVTKQLTQGANALGAILGDGWYRGYLVWNNNRNSYGDKLALLLQLQVEYTDGTTEQIITDSSWKSMTGPILSSDIYNGETFDARLVMPGWSSPGFQDNAWKGVTLLSKNKNILVASEGEPVKKIQELVPQQLITTPKGEKVFDLGQNMVGWVRLKVKGNKGDKITLTFAEVLDKAGNFYTDNLRAAKSTDVYIVRGEGEEVYEPHFTFHGFRYVRVAGFTGELTKDNITGIVIHSDITPTGTFTCSDSLINQLQSNIKWGQKGNFLDVPTDCPQRDERLGWTGDAQVFAPTACYNFNVAAFFSKWLKDMAADQMKIGAIPDVVPDVINIKEKSGFQGKQVGWAGSTGWADADVIIPWTVYQAYGDVRVLEQQYASMQGWINYMKDCAGDDYLWTGDRQYGDWLSYNTTDSSYPGAYTDKDLIANVYFARSCQLMSWIATVLGKEDDAAMYEALRQKVKDAFNKEYVTPSGRVMSNTQTAYALVLQFDMLPEPLRAPAAEYLAADVRHFGHITTGFLGTPVICQVLSDYGHLAEAYLLLNRKQYPSWLYPVTAGATTIWERWDAQRPDGSFQDVGMNSFNHYAYGAIGHWLYTVVAGLDTDPQHPGYKKIHFYPHPGGGLTHAATSIETLYGKASAAWRITDGQLTYTVEVPPNTSATVQLPQAAKNDVMLNEKNLTNARAATDLSTQGSDLLVEVGSGTYQFVYPRKE